MLDIVSRCLIFVLFPPTNRTAPVETYTPEQVAKILQVNVQTVRKWLRNGELAGADTPAGWRLTPADVEAWLNGYRRHLKQTESAA